MTRKCLEKHPSQRVTGVMSWQLFSYRVIRLHSIMCIDWPVDFQATAHSTHKVSRRITITTVEQLTCKLRPSKKNKTLTWHSTPAPFTPTRKSCRKYRACTSVRDEQAARKDPARILPRRDSSNYSHWHTCKNRFVEKQVPFAKTKSCQRAKNKIIPVQKPVLVS